ncbi:Gfo/Idh/MocA family oxidoreductase [Flavobacterium sp.]|uniref:Gfo/Idh/MocA family protein n=1 Tax=Flavobacterium sp. TaxID=239 RepID=UPI002B661380|nr:Gfo/Idh/MocA family oxidoreductase [Flavobacterium sp.]HSD06691.1 Gfo/Idh/MocA family oxidoreductase [Flavobacterium sp.]
MENNKKIKWGIVGLGNIAQQFASELQLIESAEIYAVASRNIDKAQDFANEFKCPKAYGSYDELFQDTEVDILYIATPHDSHAELTIKALENNKNVLCEKPLALHYKDVEQMVATAKKQNKFFMEAFWTRFNPSMQETLEHIRNGAIGEVKYVNADFSIKFENPDNTRMTDMKLGGGALMDIGVYPLFLAYLILGIPKEILAKSQFYSTGADAQTSIILQYENAQAVLHSSFLYTCNVDATISGTKGRINLDPLWFMTESYSLTQGDQKTKFDKPTLGKGYTYEIEECHACLRANKKESDLWSHQNSLELAKIIEDVKTQIGLQYS